MTRQARRKRGKMETEVLGLSGGRERESILRAAAWIRSGELVAFPTETVYGLGADALRDEAAARIYAAKGRPSDNPLIAHIADREQLAALVREIPDCAVRLMDAFWPGPLTLVFRKTDRVPYGTTGGLDTVAVRMPAHETARALIRAAGVPVAAPSANTSGRPSPTTAEHVLEDLGGKIPCILDGGPVGIGLESTIIDVTGAVPVILRPGYISREMVETVVGPVETDPAVEQPLSADAVPKAPGMKYRHYAPRASLTIVTGEIQDVITSINRLTAKAQQDGKLCGVICTEETKGQYQCENRKVIGSRKRPETIAHNLYAVLRQFDGDGTEVIFSESFEGGQLGQAVMNRLKKAAGYHIIQGKDEKI